MGTTAAVRMDSPSGGAGTGFYVQYDGDDVGTELQRIIERDGYVQVFAVFEAQASRYWREITPGVGDELPEYVTRFPQNIPVSRAVCGYGVLLVGSEELDASQRHTAVDLDTDGDRAYLVTEAGAVRRVMR
ncbi:MULTISPECIES: hypothetical protein [Mycolicibacter]|uniref:Immunity protein 35 domain-containing protein n=2 Tax=Mycolicibacter TaxID=1073531 RepID=A0ABU5XNR5_9MYCO|nr:MULTISPECIES: hypothetical protein [unclassified Mycolicibacter]MEB3022937.1 hypothetical protein [Mycolicibacter sp. MYC098]MEB3035076.1 hypothetical protein [Mycolicibacter sp. MYC340]